MMVAFLRRLSDAAWMVVAVLAAGTALRLGVVGFDVASAARDEQAAGTPVHRRRATTPQPSAQPQQHLEKPGVARATLMTLAVTVGPARSDVYVNREIVGQTPFFGDISCKSGEPLRIEVVPSQAPLLSFDRACRHGLLRLDRPDGEDPLKGPAK